MRENGFMSSFSEKSPVKLGECLDQSEERVDIHGPRLPTSFSETSSPSLHGFCTVIDVGRRAESAEVGRISALDFTKGILVLIMVLYHWINYFVGSDWPYYRYLRFLTPSFILVTGFLISNVYLSKYKVTGWRLSRRLFTRGLKLLTLFFGLNMARIALLLKLDNNGFRVERFNLRRIADAFAAGNVYTVTGKSVVFYILIPIGYLLIISALLVVPYKVFKYAFHVACIFFLTCIFALGYSGLHSDNLGFVTIGFLGVLVGFAPIEKLNTSISHPSILAIAYSGYLIAITVWNVPFSLQIVGAFLSVGGIYLIGLRGTHLGKTRSHIILLGQYSLFGYVTQIAVLQLLSALLRDMNLGQAALGVSFVAAFALTIISVEAVHRERRTSKTFDGIYKAIFA
jgi:peptidoglycan/LPS O-acetylase OafA/YrhL